MNLQVYCVNKKNYLLLHTLLFIHVEMIFNQVLCYLMQIKLIMPYVKRIFDSVLYALFIIHNQKC